MPTVTAALVYEGDSSRSMINALAASSLVSGVILVGEVHETDGSATANLEIPFAFGGAIKLGCQLHALCVQGIGFDDAIL